MFSGLPAGISLREETAEDESFLRDLLASVREDLAILDPSIRGPILNFQFRAQRESYRSAFPNGRFLIICEDGQPIGNLVIDVDESIQLIDISLMPSCRNRGIGTALIRGLGSEKKDVTLEVVDSNRARALYERLGFVECSRSGMHVRMKWNA